MKFFIIFISCALTAMSAFSAEEYKPKNLICVINDGYNAIKSIKVKQPLIWSTDVYAYATIPADPDAPYFKLTGTGLEMRVSTHFSIATREADIRMVVTKTANGDTVGIDGEVTKNWKTVGLSFHDNSVNNNFNINCYVTSEEE